MESSDKINMGEIQVQHQQKIEEAFLYIIQLKKEIDDLKQDNKRLEHKISKLK